MKAKFLPLLAVSVWANLANAQQYSYAGLNNATLSAQNISYSDATGAPLSGFFAYDNSTTSKRGLVVIIPDWDGIGNYERWRATQLATLGYAAWVADIYTTAVTQGPSLPTANRSALSQMYTSNQTLLVARINGALDTAKKQAVADPSNIAVTGYCFGGGAALQLARSYPSPSSQGLKGVMTFHGAPLAYKAGDKNFTQGANITISIQNGYADPSNNASQIASIQNELEAALIPFIFTQYGETVHAFTEPDLAPWTPSTQGTMAYTQLSDVLSWWALRAFLLQIFGDVAAATNPYVGEPGVWDTRSNALALPTS